MSPRAPDADARIDEAEAESFPASDPHAGTLGAEGGAVARVLVGRPRDLGGFTVRRTIPTAQCRHIGPFVFFDHMGPVAFPPGDGITVRPHPHIQLATVTYLFEGEIIHRDSLGSHQAIHPGDVNWMTAGRGIVHSERSSPERRAAGSRLHGIQCWVALPKAHEESDPGFWHHPDASIPRVEREGVGLRVIVGEAYGVRSPVEIVSPTFYVEARFSRSADLPLPDVYLERGAYVVEGRVEVEGESHGEGSLIVFRENVPVVLRGEEGTRVMLLGGAPLDGERHIWWNFVSSSLERIEQAKADWREGRFPKVPGDEDEFIPLPAS